MRQIPFHIEIFLNLASYCQYIILFQLHLFIFRISTLFGPQKIKTDIKFALPAVLMGKYSYSAAVRGKVE